MSSYVGAFKKRTLQSYIKLCFIKDLLPKLKTALCNALTSVRPGVMDVKFPISAVPRYFSVNCAANSPVGSSIPV